MHHIPAEALGTGFLQFAQPVFQRCINITQSQQLAKVNPVSAGGQYDKEFIVCSLDLPKVLVAGWKVWVVSFMCALVCRLSEFLEVAGKLSRREFVDYPVIPVVGGYPMLCKPSPLGQKQKRIKIFLSDNCPQYMKTDMELNKSLVEENSAITLGRLAWVVRSLCHHIWSIICSHGVLLCEISEMRSEDLHNEDCEVLHGYKQVLHQATLGAPLEAREFHSLSTMETILLQMGMIPGFLFQLPRIDSGAVTKLAHDIYLEGIPFAKPHNRISRLYASYYFGTEAM